MLKIVITKRTDDWHACIDGDSSVWDCGRTPNEAVGALVRNPLSGVVCRFQDKPPDNNDGVTEA